MLNVGATEIILIFAILFFIAVPVIIILGIFWYSSRNKQPADLKQCPFCAEKIQAQAKVCRFCGRDVPV